MNETILTAVALEQAREDAIALFGELPAECDPFPPDWDSLPVGDPLELEWPEEPWPSPEQLAAEANVDLPY